MHHAPCNSLATKQNSGFTLIELSIVLVIIGLLVGGILSGQDLINAAAQRAQITQIERYNTAVLTFEVKYNGLPGDLSLTDATQFGFQTINCNGTIGNRDGNKYIDGYWSGGPTWVLQEGEALLFWQDLTVAKLIDGTFLNGGATQTGCAGITADSNLVKGVNYVGDYIPVAKIENGNFIYVYDNTHNGDSCCISGNNWYGVSAITSVLANGGMMSNPALSVMQAYNIDKKIDDSIPTTGNVQAIYLNAWYVWQANAQASDSTTSCFNTTTNTYSTSINGGSGKNCALSFQFQTQ